MAYDIENYDPSGNDGTQGIGDGYGRANFPPNYDGGDKIEAVGYGVELARMSDLILDPMREPSSNDPATGWDVTGQRVSED